MTAGSACAFAEPIAVVVSKQSKIDTLSRKDVIDIFMGRFDILDSGVKVKALDYPNGYFMREDFYQALVNKSERQISAYWSRLLFSGRAKPPEQVNDIAQSIASIETNTSLISYVPADQVSEEVKVVLLLE